MKKQPLHAISLLTSLALVVSLVSCTGEKAEEQPVTDSGEWSQLIIEPPMIHFYAVPGGDSPDEILQIWSDGDEVDWTLSTDAPWLSLSKTHGTARSLVVQRKLEVILSVDNSNLKEGSYSTVLLAHSEQNNYTRELPVFLHSTGDQPGQTPDIDIVMEPQGELHETLFFTQPEVRFAELPKSVTSVQYGQDGPQLMYYFPGDLCLLVSGKLRNDTDNDTGLFLRGEGYNKEGNQISWSVQVHNQYLWGGDAITVTIPANSTVDFELYLNWAKDIRKIKIFAGIRENPEIPLP